MTTSRKQKAGRRLSLLRSQVAAGNLQAHYELGHELLDGLRDKRGRLLVRRNPAYAVRLFRVAAEGGFTDAFGALAYAYDTGQGTRLNRAEAERWYRRAYRNGSSTAAGNLGTIFRDAADLRSAFRWYKRAAELNDGDAMVDVAYGYQYGIGVRKSLLEARKLYRRAMRSRQISRYGREEAMYGLAVSFGDAGQLAQAIPLLKAADADGDYPEAAELLGQIESREPLEPCRCRRFLRKSLRGHARCGVHKNGPRRG